MIVVYCSTCCVDREVHGPNCARRGEGSWLKGRKPPKPKAEKPPRWVDGEIKRKPAEPKPPKPKLQPRLLDAPGAQGGRSWGDEA